MPEWTDIRICIGFQDSRINEKFDINITIGLSGNSLGLG